MRVWASNATTAGGRGWRLTDAVIDNVIDHCALKLGRVRVRVDGYHRYNAIWGDGGHSPPTRPDPTRLDFDQDFDDLLRESQSPSQSVSAPSQANPPTSGVNPETNCAV
ncbi:hypothetical protein G5I_03334 [Acromyrmex echinatior]|uniref:Uncharacterized protein n=1 Tax=Acromyrmex echinatior TaxID=103372 RepID=F4WCQ8_ACREC|nr:hypothetical protein G5I_03334 [Acromyrmex echinatior]